MTGAEHEAEAKRLLLGLINRYADLNAAAPGESEHGSGLTADRLNAHAVTVLAEIRARLGMPLPSPDEPGRDLLNLSNLVDSTSGCPAEKCRECGSTQDLTAELATCPVGVYCYVRCWRCIDECLPPEEPFPLGQCYALVLAHADHMGVQLPHLAAALAAAETTRASR